jgi:hypothetical protein
MQTSFDMTEIDLRSMTREALEDLMEKIMFRLHQLDAQDLQREIIRESQKLPIVASGEPIYPPEPY